MSRTTNPSSQPSKVFGLDLLRAIAVLTVLLGHTLMHGDPPHWMAYVFGAQGVTGVEIFYVLSGYLIGHILLRSADAGRLHTPSDITDFWKRRWARTLPLYIFFVVLYMRLDYHGIVDYKYIAPFFLFMQNLAWPMLPFFTHSWSLAVEEWFYLLLPITFVSLHAFLKTNRRAFFGTSVLFLGIPLISRIIFAHKGNDWDAFDLHVRSIVVCRLDSIFIGVICAYVRLNHARAFARVARYWPASLAVFLLLSGILSVNSALIAGHFITRVFYFPLLSLSIACLMPAAAKVKTTGITMLDRFISHTSKVSYSLYLGHIAMLSTALYVMQRVGLSEHGGVAGTMLMYVAFGVLYYLFANLTYLLIEQPYIRLRDIKLGHSDVRSGNVAVAVEQKEEIRGTA